MTLSVRQIRLVAAFAGINLLLVVVGWVALISPQRSAAAAAAAKAQAAQSARAALGSTGSNGSTKQPSIHTAGVYTLDTALPSQLDEPDLILELNRIAAASGVKILNLSPQAGQGMPNGYTVQPINLSLNGSYFNLTHFLHTLRSLVSERNGQLIANGPLFSVNSVGLTPGQASDATAHSDVATVVIAAYYYGTVDGAAPPASTSTTDTTTTTGG
jgi:hypothetical protein